MKLKSSIFHLFLAVLTFILASGCMKAEKIAFDTSTPAGAILSVVVGAIASSGATTTPTATTPTGTGAVASPKAITAFSFVGNLNNLTTNYAGTITGTNIAVSLPYAIVSKSIPSFTTDGASVKIGATVQTSGVTPNTFTAPVIYTVTATDGTTQDYTVTVTPITPVPDSGQIKCFDPAGGSTATPDCIGSLGQDGAFWSSRSFSPVTLTNVSDYTTRDLITGLTWKTCLEGLSGATCAAGGASTAVWSGAACNTLNTFSYGGKTNWRLPTVTELRHLLNHGVIGIGIPVIFTTAFPGTVPGIAFDKETWSATQIAGNSFGVSFDYGGSVGRAITNLYMTRCVAGDSPPAQSFTDNADSTVRDNRTGLIWHKCAGTTTGLCSGTLTTFTWAQALTYCNNSTLGGRGVGSWRLPNVNELASIIDYTASPTISTAFGTTFTNASYHTSTTIWNDFGSSWTVGFATGVITKAVKTTNSGYVRCVSN